LDELQDTDNLQFSDKYSLLLHMWEPPKTDTRAKRPAMVMIHGGGFKSNDRNNVKGLIDWCQQLAMRGYVTVSIDYRLEGPGNLEKPNIDACTMRERQFAGFVRTAQSSESIRTGLALSDRPLEP
jgi:carboxylesterase type B